MALRSQASLTEGFAQGIVPMRAFSIQYLSLVLIILTFTIGVFSGHKIQTQKHKAIEQKVSLPPATTETFVTDKSATFGAMNLDNLFEVGTSELNALVFDSLAEVLQSHDIDARFEVTSPVDAINADSALAIAMGRSAVLFRALLDRGIPVDAAQVFAVDETGDSSVRVSFAKSKLPK